MKNAQETIELLGGRKAVMEITGLTKGRISQWVSENKIPKYWLLQFHLMRPDLISDPRAERPLQASTGATPVEAAHG